MNHLIRGGHPGTLDFREIPDRHVHVPDGPVGTNRHTVAAADAKCFAPRHQGRVFAFTRGGDDLRRTYRAANAVLPAKFLVDR